jgi:hypothetical protein
MRYLAIAICLFFSGCAGQRSIACYTAGDSRDYFISARLQELTTNQIERGERRPLLDAVGWTLGIPGKVILWDRRVDRHQISPETEQAIAEYLAANDLASVKVRLNQYAPGDEWRRLVANDVVGAGWRYTFGTVSWLGDTIFPGRLFGGDHFNPYTNTLNIYSDVPAIGLHEAGHAKDWARRRYKGSYAAIYVLPGFPLWHEAVATRDALAYLKDKGSAEEQKEAYRLLYPAYGTYVGSAVGDFVPGVGFVSYAGAVVVGHVAGRVQGRLLSDQARTNAVAEPSQDQGPAFPIEKEPQPDTTGSEQIQGA